MQPNEVSAALFYPVPRVRVLLVMAAPGRRDGLLPALNGARRELLLQALELVRRRAARALPMRTRASSRR
jgi:hypothetical protein